MRNLIPLLIFLFLFTGCAKKETDPPQKEEPVVPVQQPESSETGILPPANDGVLTDDDIFYTEALPETFSQPEAIEVETPQILEPDELKIDTVDPTEYLEYGGKFWDAVYVGTKPVGFQSTEFSRQVFQDHPILCAMVHNHIQVLHQGVPLELSAAHRSVETLQGELIGSESVIQRDNLLINQVARVIDDSLEITTTIGEQTAQEVLPWKIGARTGGVCEMQVSLFKNPIQDNEERRVSFYDPTRRTVIEAVLTAADIEPVELPGNRVLNLRRIETTFRTPQEQIPITFWTDAMGNIIQMSTPFMGTETLTTIRTTEDAVKEFTVSASNHE